MGFLAEHWAFFTFALTAAMVMQVFKASVWTRARAESKGRAAGLFWWARKTLPLHPVAAGALFGLIPGLPLSPEVPETMASTCLYYAAAGLVSTWAFDILKGLAKRRGLDLSRPEVPR